MDRFPILGAVTGILLTLLMEGTIERFVSISKRCSSPKVLKLEWSGHSLEFQSHTISRTTLNIKE